jgi:hypothetical protein
VDVEGPVHIAEYVVPHVAIDLQASALAGKAEERPGTQGRREIVAYSEPVRMQSPEGLQRMIERVAARPAAIRP